MKKMTKVGLLSDTHGWLDPAIYPHFEDCTEIWHAGDVGNLDTLEQLKSWGIPLRGVYGNIDGQEIRALFPERQLFELAGLKVLIQHIGGYPGRYAPGVKKQIEAEKPGLFISGHSHIVKVLFDSTLHCLHMNPGAAGRQGWHQVRTLLTFCIENGTCTNAKLIELGARSAGVR